MAFLDIPRKERWNRSAIGTESRARRHEFRPVGRQAAVHKQIKMKLTEKVQRRTRNALICLTIICLTPLCKNGRTLSGAHSVNAYAGEELVCAIDLGNEMYGRHGLETGLNYRLLGEFAKANHCNVKVIAAGKDENYTDSLRQGKVDLVITRDTDLDGLSVLSEIGKHSTWALDGSDRNKVRQMNGWIGHIKASGELQRLQNLFSASYDPHKRAENGVVTSVVSPYDEIIKKHARTLGWDWRMVAAIIWQESKFAIGSRSFRGAEGLMQVMPQTGRYYGIDNLIDPEQNIIAGTNHLRRLQNMFCTQDIPQDELIKFTLAAYNAGEGRISDCRNLAQAKGFDSSNWDETVKVIPMMRDDSILKEETVKHGKFQGLETIGYVESVMSHYKVICQICPTSF